MSTQSERAQRSTKAQAMNHSAQPSWLRWVVQVGLLAVLYAVIGRLSLLLAIPPGYAAPVWPSAGLALAGLLVFGSRVWPGVLLGSFLVNIWTGLDTSSLASFLKAIPVPIGIGLGASLQAVVGAWLIRRLVGWPTPLDTGKAITKFLLLGGPVSCAINATCGVSSLLAAGFIAPSQYAVNWGTWWVGDTIGVLVLAPLLLLWIGPLARSSRSRCLLVTVPLTVALMLTIIAFLNVRSMERARFLHEFDTRTASLTETVRRSLESYLNVLSGTAAFCASSEAVTRQGFHTFVTLRLTQSSAFPGIQGLSWNPRVPTQERDAYEAAARQDGLAQFQFTERNPEGQLVRAGLRQDYFPVYFMEPVQGNAAALGYDVASEPTRAEALRRSRRSGSLTATAPVHLVQETAQQSGFLAVRPIYRRGASTDTAEQRDASLEGFVMGVFRAGDLVLSALHGIGYHDLRFTVVDVTEPDAPKPLTAIEMDPEPTLSSSMQDEAPRNVRDALRSVRTLDVGGRRWELRFTPTHAYLATFRTWEVWAVLMGGLLFAGLLGALLLVGTGYTSRIEQLVIERTAQLSETNAALQREIAERKKVEAEVAAKSKELEALLYVTSHDLTEPLRSIENFSRMVLDEHGGRLDEEGQDLLRRVVKGGARMHLLLNDILTLSRVRRIMPPTEEVQGEAIVREALDRLSVRIQETNAKVQVAKDLPRLRADRTWATQVVYNLVFNALKFTRPGESPDVEIAAYRPTPTDSDGEGFVVRDRRPGVAPEHAERIFNLFERAVGREVEGTGAGLAIVQAVAERHGGKTWVRPREGGGSEFIVTFGKTRG